MTSFAFPGCSLNKPAYIQFNDQPTPFLCHGAARELDPSLRLFVSKVQKCDGYEVIIMEPWSEEMLRQAPHLIEKIKGQERDIPLLWEVKEKRLLIIFHNKWLSPEKARMAEDRDNSMFDTLLLLYRSKGKIFMMPSNMSVYFEVEEGYQKVLKRRNEQEAAPDVSKMIVSVAADRSNRKQKKECVIL